MSDYPKHLYRVPGPYGIAPKSFAVAGASNEDEEAALIAKGWSLSLDEARGGDAFDHDKDGKAGGSKAPEGDKADLAAKRAEYEKALGKKPFPGWDIAELQRRIDEKGK